MLLVINAACTDTDIKWIKQHISPAGISISKEKENYIFLAIQGPKSSALLQSLTEESIINMPAFSHNNMRRPMCRRKTTGTPNRRARPNREARGPRN